MGRLIEQEIISILEGYVATNEIKNSMVFNILDPMSWITVTRLLELSEQKKKHAQNLISRIWALKRESKAIEEHIKIESESEAHLKAYKIRNLLTRIIELQRLIKAAQNWEQKINVPDSWQTLHHWRPPKDYCWTLGVCEAKLNAQLLEIEQERIQFQEIIEADDQLDLLDEADEPVQSYPLAQAVIVNYNEDVYQPQKIPPEVYHKGRSIETYNGPGIIPSAPPLQ